MQQIPTKKVLKLLEAENPPEVRSAAAVVLGEVAARDAEVSRALSECLDDEIPAVRLEAIRAIGKLRVTETLSRLLERIPVGGEESHAAAVAVAHFGTKGREALQELMHRVAPGVRRTIAAALAAEGAATKSDVSLGVLLDKDPAVVEAAVRSLSEQMPSLDRDHRTALGKQLLEWLGNKKSRLPPVNEAAVVRLLGALGDERAGPLVWDRIQPAVAAEIRIAALQALGKWADAPSKDQLKRLLECAADRNFRIAAPALMILQRLPVADRAVPDWLALFDTPDVQGRRLALEKVGDRDTKEVAAAMVRQLRHPDRELREAALSCLARLEKGREALLGALLEAETPDQAWVLARTQVQIARDHPGDWRDEVFKTAGQHIEVNDRRAEPLLFFLRETDAHDLRDRLEERGVHWRKKKDYERALHYFRLLARDPACGFPIRLELASCGLKVSSQDLSATARASDPALQQFMSLCQIDADTLIDTLSKSKWLEPEDLYYLGFHLAEHEGRAKKCGGEVLKLVSKRSPRSKLAQAAKSKLKISGLD
jgi:HEAT repeat protein